MKIILEIDQVSHESLNEALRDFSELMNQHFVASGNKVMLIDEKEAPFGNFDAHNSKTKYTWIMNVSLEWEKSYKKD